MKYPYYLAPGAPRIASIPLIRVIYKNQTKRTTPVLALVDSGASVSFAPLDLAVWLGVQIDSKHALDIRGFNNVVTKCYPGTITIEIDGHDFVLPVYFGGRSDMQCIIGQDPFFDMAKIVFERYDDSFSIERHARK
ncbi:retroviral-like aspartic protease [Candidatus Gottesmanbacteria bacterium]|nr:retroviral-like aspartic protease [Candidatus Gottesmanbacteria bacterium]